MFQSEKRQNYTLESMPSSTTLIQPNFVDTPKVPNEAISARNLLSAASAFANKQNA